MKLRSQLGKIRSHLLSTMYRRPAAIGNFGPVVTFTFDDFPQSALTVGAAIIESFKARATYYVSMGLMNAKNDLGPQFCSNDLHALVERGHEVALHGFGHLSARKTPVKQFIADIDRGEATLQQFLNAGVSRNFAYPYGHATLSAKRRLGPRMSSSRGTIAGLNGPEVDLNLLRANHLYGDINELDQARDLISENARRSSWLIFYSHDVAQQPSRFGCTPSLLQKTVQFAAEQGATILTVADVVRTICPAV
jgi:peptidoglycan/xylan/chitin deacetylase (PgdA/CDA1 family)